MGAEWQFCWFGNYDKKYSSAACFSTTKTTRQESNGLIFNNIYFEVFCQVKCLVGMKNVWRNSWKLRLVGLFNIQVIIPTEMYCKWMVCLTSLSAVSTSLFSTNVGTKTTHTQEDNLNKAVFQSAPFLWPSETNRINLLPGQRCSS